MDMTKEIVNDWLKKHRRSRSWLAEQCDTQVPAVGHWLKAKDARPIPKKAVIIITNLMAIDDAKFNTESARKQNLVLEFDQQTFDNICTKAAESEKHKLPRKWSENILASIANDDIEALAALIHAHEDALEKQNSGGDHSTERRA